MVVGSQSDKKRAESLNLDKYGFLTLCFINLLLLLCIYPDIEWRVPEHPGAEGRLYMPELCFLN